MKVNLKSKSGITLVALIITIIVLLILAMVSIALVMNSGIITKSKTAVDKYSEEEIQEQIKLAYAEWQTAQFTSDAGDAATFMQSRLRKALKYDSLTVTGGNGVFVVKLSNNKQYIYDSKAGGMLDEVPVSAYPEATPGIPTTENSKYTSNNKTAVIPAGYTVDATQNSIDNGLVISKDGNEWVWIPVSSADLALMYTEDTTGWTMTGTSGENAVVTKYKTPSRTEIRSDLIRGNPGDTSSYREPDTVVGDDGNSYDKVQENWSAAGFVSFNDMATKLKDDYKNMIDSVRKNGGFYVGRYELSEAGTKKDQPSLTNTNWYNLYAKCKTFGDESTTYSRMIWGCQWDQVCKFINTSGDKVSLTDSRTYGNYGNSQAPANTENYSSYTKRNTGSNDAWKTNNIYDLAGNCQEWTQGSSYTGNRTERGGRYYDSGDGAPVASYSSDNSDYSYGDGISSRPVLYVK